MGPFQAKNGPSGVLSAFAYFFPLCLTFNPAALSCGPAAFPAPSTRAQGPFGLYEDASGRFDVGNLAVFGYSEDGPSEDDPQVYAKLKPDMVLRSWFVDRGDTTAVDDYDLDFRDSCREQHIIFMGGLDLTAINPDQAESPKEFKDWATRDADDRLVDHPENDPSDGYYERARQAVVRGQQPPSNKAYKVMRRGSLANPEFRNRDLKLMETQIDLGADGLVLAGDEAGGYRGNAETRFNGDEGYDAYFLADFNRYLMDEHPFNSAADWESRYRMAPGRAIDRGIPWNDLNHNFDYGSYLRGHGWSSDPKNRGYGGSDCSANPLAAEWGDLPYPPDPLRPRPGFLGVASAYYWKLLVLKIREYARAKYHKEILVTGEGIKPYVDLNEYPLSTLNRDDGGKAADYLPLSGNGHLDGARSLMGSFKALRRRSRAVSGAVPLVLYLDMGLAGYSGRYDDLSVPEKEDYWRIFVPEAYACGLFYAFHLRAGKSAQPNATAAGVIDFMDDYAGFFKRNRQFYKNVEDDPVEVRVGAFWDVQCNVMKQGYRNRTIVHLINHDYKNGEMIAQNGLTVTMAMDAAPLAVHLISPDIAGAEKVAYTFQDHRLTMDVKSLLYYDVLVIKGPLPAPPTSDWVLCKGGVFPCPHPVKWADAEEEGFEPSPSPTPSLPAPPAPEFPTLPPAAVPAFQSPPAGPPARGGGRPPEPAHSPGPVISTPEPRPAAATIAVPTAVPCKPRRMISVRRVWQARSRTLAFLKELRLGRADEGATAEFSLRFSLDAPTRVWAEADIRSGLRPGDTDGAPEVFLDDAYLGPMLTEHQGAWRSPSEAVLGRGSHRLLLRISDAEEAPLITLGRIRVLGDAKGSWRSIKVSRPCGCGGPPCPPGSGPRS